MGSHINSLKYWTDLINDNEVNSKMFVEAAITEETKFLHYIIFTRNSGIENKWIAMPNAKKLLGFIKYCFLPEAYYNWVESRDKSGRMIPIITIEQVLLSIWSRLTEEENQKIINETNHLRELWDLGDEEIMSGLKDLEIAFNKDWAGNENSFLYFKVFNDARELGEFVLEANETIGKSEISYNKDSLNHEEWLNLCSNVINDKKAAESFKKILINGLTEVI